MSTRRYVILGNGIAGQTAAEELRASAAEPFLAESGDKTLERLSSPGPPPRTAASTSFASPQFIGFRARLFRAVDPRRVR